MSFCEAKLFVCLFFEIFVEKRQHVHQTINQKPLKLPFQVSPETQKWIIAMKPMEFLNFNHEQIGLAASN